MTQDLTCGQNSWLPIALLSLILVAGGCDGSGDGGDDLLRVNTVLNGLIVQLTITYAGGESESFFLDEVQKELRTSYSLGAQYTFLATTSDASIADSDLTTCTVNSNGVETGTTEILVTVGLLRIKPKGPLGTKLLVACTEAGNWEA